MKRIRLFLTGLLLLFTATLFAQNIQVKGTVTDASTGEPIPYASIQVKGTMVGTATDDNGNYSISVPANGVLIFSSVGYTNIEAQVMNRTLINAALPVDAIALEDVMVVAYGTAKKAAFTGSASVMDSKSIEKRQVSNVTNALAGAVPGVQAITGSGQPGSSATIRIRGFGSMSASNSPLYVVDNIPYDGSISAINPTDIESITVLKDASAAAIYGHRGANGVIMITTKRGVSQDAVITFESRLGNNARAVPNYNVMTDPAMYLETLYQAAYNSRAGIGQSAYDSHVYANNYLSSSQGTGYKIYTVPTGEYLIGTNGKINPSATLGYSDGTYFYTPDNWYNELFKGNNLRQEYIASFSGKSDKLSYYMSMGYLDDTGIIVGSNFSRLSTRLKADYQAKKWLKVGANLAYSNQESKAPYGSGDPGWGSSGNIFYVTSMISPVYPFYVRDKDGNKIMDNRVGEYIVDYGSGSTNFTRSFLSMSNPSIEHKLNKNSSISDNFTGKYYANFTPIKSLTISANLGMTVGNARSSNLYNPFYGSSASSGGQVSVSHGRQIAVTQQLLANFKETFSGHTVDILAGYETYSRKYQSLYGWNQKIFNPLIGELDNAIYGKNPSPTASSYTTNYATQGYLARAQYDYNEKYFFSASYRRDASSRFAPEKRWGNFGSVGAAWIISNENFLKGIKPISLLKLKASWGLQGNDDLGNLQPYLDQFVVKNSNGDFSLQLGYKGNRNITWEKSNNINIGFEFGFFGDRITGSVDLFDRVTRDMLYNQPVAPSNGYTSIPMNVGSMRNRGIEVLISGVLVQTKDIYWSVSANATSYKNTILSLHPDVAETGIKYSRSIISVGGSIFDSYLQEYAGVDPNTGKALYYKDILGDDGKPTGERELTDVYANATQYNNGSGLAKLMGGFSTSLTLYGVDLSAQFGYQLGGKIYDFGYEELMHNGQSDMGGCNWHFDILKAWTLNNPNSNIPRLNSLDNTRQQNSTRYLISSDYLSIDNISLGYTFPKKWTEKISIHKLRIFAQADNVWLFSKRQGLDPRQDGAFGTGWAGSYKYNSLRTISGGLSITF